MKILRLMIMFFLFSNGSVMTGPVISTSERYIYRDINKKLRESNQLKNNIKPSTILTTEEQQELKTKIEKFINNENYKDLFTLWEEISYPKITIVLQSLPPYVGVPTREKRTKSAAQMILFQEELSGYLNDQDFHTNRDRSARLILMGLLNEVVNRLISLDPDLIAIIPLDKGRQYYLDEHEGDDRLRIAGQKIYIAPGPRHNQYDS